jgi:glycosyltransferase involved in cell wall biosynthesis
MAKLAFISGMQLFPAQSGGQLRSTGLARALARHGFDVAIYSLIGRSPDYRARKPSELVELGPRLTEYIDRRPAKAAIQFATYRINVPPIWISEYLRFRTPAPLAERLAAADAVIADNPFVARVFANTDKPRVLNTHNIEHNLVPRGALSGLLRSRVKRLEDEAAGEADVVCCCAAADAEYFRGAGSREVVMVPNGIDVTRFEAARVQREAMRLALGVKPDEVLLLFPASRFGPNKEAYDWLVNFIVDHPNEMAKRKVKFCVVGSVVGAPEQHGPLTATGRVLEIEPYFAAADFGLNPMFTGAGTNVKMADFIAARLPILTTCFGARNLLLKKGHSALFFEPETFLARLDEAMATSPTQRVTLASAAYAANAEAIDMNLCVKPLVDWLKRNSVGRHDRSARPQVDHGVGSA